MNYSYDVLYLPLVQRLLGDMYDYAVNTLHVALEDYHKMFLGSGIAGQVERGNPTYTAGKNGCELAREVIEICTGEQRKEEDVMWLDKSCEYWIGWILAYYQWKSARSFRSITQVVSMQDLVSMYPTYHEADVEMFVEVVDERFAAMRTASSLKRLRTYAQLSQRQLAELSEVPLRQIQLFEQGQRDIRKTQATTLERLSQALHCRIEDLL